MALPSALAKQYGPFNGITWLGVIGGGAALAYFLRKSFSGGSKAPTEQVTTDTRQALGLPGTTYHQDTSGPVGDQGAPISGDTKTPGTGGSTAPSPTKPPSTPAPKPGLPPPPAKPPTTPAPVVKKPMVSGVKTPTVAQGGQAIFTGSALSLVNKVTFGGYISLAVTHSGDTQMSVTVPPTTKVGPQAVVVFYSGGTVTAPTIIITAKAGTAPATPAPKPGNDIPGGFPADCTGVFSPPRDHPGANVIAWIHSSNNPSQRAGEALAWAVGGQTTALTPSKLQAMKSAINLTATWPLINAQRRTRGLRPLSHQMFVSLQGEITAQAKSGRDAFPDGFVQHLWDTYHMPYLCTNRPANSGSRANNYL